MEFKDYNHNVFLNCPFDDKYKELFYTAIFAVMDCGFSVRCALETTDASQVRIQKIYEQIASCRFGIHDLSRTQLDKKSQLPRFNMPLELGIFLGAKFLGDKKQREKVCLVFDEEPFRYQKYLSDIAGQDINSHHGEPSLMVREIRRANALKFQNLEQIVFIPTGFLAFAFDSSFATLFLLQQIYSNVPQSC